jgi:hypothetical protein
MSVSEVCAISEVLCLVSDRHYIESGNCSVSDEEKGRCAHAIHISYMRRREMRPPNPCLISEETGDASTQWVCGRAPHRGSRDSMMAT